MDPRGLCRDVIRKLAKSFHGVDVVEEGNICHGCKATGRNVGDQQKISIFTRITPQ